MAFRLTYRECHVTDLDHCYETYKCIKCNQNRQLSCQYFDNYLGNIRDYWSFEGWIVALADEIAQRHHDIEDSIRYNLISREELLEKLRPFEGNFRNDDRRNYRDLNNASQKDIDEFLRLFSRFIVHYYVCDVIETTRENLKMLSERLNISKTEDFKAIRPEQASDDMAKVVAFSEHTKQADSAFQNFLKEKILGSFMAQSMDGKGQFIIRKLFQAYMSDPCQMSDGAIKQFFHEINIQETSRFAIKDHITGYENTLMRVICDYIGSMTDSYAYKQFDIMYGTRV